MIFVDPSMFTGDIHIPNMDEACVQDFETFKLIAKWEKECLELVLGKCLFDQLMEQMEIKTEAETNRKYYALKDNAPQEWKWLTEGRTYKKDDDFVKHFSDLSLCGCGCNSGKCEHHVWDGFVTTTSTIVNGKVMSFKESFLAYYIYFMWSFNNQSRTTGIGEQQPESKNSVTVTNKMKRIDAYNYFYSKVQVCSKAGRTGLYGFINEHSDLYPDFQGTDLEPKNYFDV